ncbi:MAG: hypothetical protein AAB221_04875, partial [Bacteroidota bacterium]
MVEKFCCNAFEPHRGGILYISPRWGSENKINSFILPIFRLYEAIKKLTKSTCSLVNGKGAKAGCLHKGVSATTADDRNCLHIP